MYQVYTEKNHSELSRSYNYIVEKTDGSFNSYGDLIATVVAEG